MKTTFYLLMLCILSYVEIHAQNTCNNPIELCFTNNSSISFPATTSGNAQGGAAYGCLLTQPRPTWFYIKTNAAITNSVTQFVISSSANFDIDAIIWGPSPSNTAFCSVISNSTSIIDCSYSTSVTETITISNTQANQYYILMVTNFNGSPQNINITCTQGGNNINCNANTPNADFSLSNSTICAGQSVQLTDLSAPAGSITSWYYNSSAATIPYSTLQNPTFTFNTPGTHTISLAVASSGSLTSTITKTIQVVPKPTVSITLSNQTICAGKTATINLTGATAYTTSPGNITSSSFTVNPSTTTIYAVTGINTFGCSGYVSDTLQVITSPTILSSANPSGVCLGSNVTFSNSGSSTYTLSPTGLTGSIINTVSTIVGTKVYTVTGTASTGCSNTTTVSVLTYSLPVILITPSNTTICAGSSVTLSGSGGVSYTWNGGFNTSQLIIVSPTVTSTYSVDGFDSNNCQNTASTTVNVVSTPIVSINSPSTSICMGYTMAVVANGAASYTWSNGATTDTTNIQPFTNVTYSVIGSNGGSCKDTAFLNIVVKPLPTVLASANTTLACTGQTVNLTASGNAVNYLWQPNSLLGANQVVQILAPTTYTVYGQGTNGCAFLNTIFVNVQNGNAVIPVVTPSAVCIGDTAFFSVIGGTVPSWSASIIPNSSFVTPITATSYTLSASDFNGCLSDIVFTVGINSDCDVLVYNAFTPNGDGINDFFIIDNIDKYPHSNVYIYNRWGNKLFNTTGYNNQTNNWDGKVNGIAVTAGTYFYTITNDKNKLLKKGWIEITN